MEPVLRTGTSRRFRRRCNRRVATHARKGRDRSRLLRKSTMRPRCPAMYTWFEFARARLHEQLRGHTSTPRLFLPHSPATLLVFAVVLSSSYLHLSPLASAASTSSPPFLPKTQLPRARSYTSLSRTPHHLVPHIAFPTSLVPPPFTPASISTFHCLHTLHSLAHLSILFTCPLPLVTSPLTQLQWVQGITACNMHAHA